MSRKDWLIISVVLAIYLLFPGDVPWVNDEPLLMRAALDANRDGRLVSLGLLGTSGVRYGALPTWIYQGLLALTHDLIAVATLKIVIMLSGTLVALFSLKRRLSYDWLPLALVFVSPYFYFYHRIPWDNCFLIPAVALFFASVVRFVDKADLKGFCGILFFATIAIHIHLMSILVLFPASMLALLFQRRWVLSHLAPIAIFTTLALLASSPYLLYLVGTPSLPSDSRGSFAKNLPLLITGIQFLGAVDFFRYFIPEVKLFLGGAYWILFGLTLTLLIPLWIYLRGVGQSMREVIPRLRSRKPLSRDQKLSLICLSAILCHTGFFILTRKHHHPHYFNAAWFPYFFFVWKTASGTLSALGRRLLGAHVATSGVLLIFCIGFIHIHGGTRGIHYGTVLKEQIRVVREGLSEFPSTSTAVKPRLEVLNYGPYPQGYAVLEEIYRDQVSPPAASSSRPVGTPVLTYRDKDSKISGWLMWQDLEKPVD